MVLVRIYSEAENLQTAAVPQYIFVSVPVICDQNESFKTEVLSIRGQEGQPVPVESSLNLTSCAVYFDVRNGGFCKMGHQFLSKLPVQNQVISTGVDLHEKLKGEPIQHYANEDLGPRLVTGRIMVPKGRCSLSERALVRKKKLVVFSQACKRAAVVEVADRREDGVAH